VVVLTLPDQDTRARADALKGTLAAYPDVLGAAASYHTPGRGLGRYLARIEGEDDWRDVPTYIVDYDFIETLGMEMAAGRAFDPAFPSDATSSFIINETAAAQFGWGDPLGKRINWDNSRQGTVVGVVEDFHFESLYAPIAPLVMFVDPMYYARLSVRIRPQNLPATLAFLEDAWKAFAPDWPFEYTFLDADFEAYYMAEQQATRLIRIAALLAIMVACLGLFGLATFSVQRRTKEIGVRKVLGASVPGIVLLLSKEFLALVALAFLAAVPVGYVALQQWLQDFAYRIALSPWFFLAAGLMALLIAWLTVGYQSIKAARANPTQSLRYE
jgi:putative ABC transport system permease protein